MSAAIESLLPHRAPMRFIDALLECTDETATATACFAEKPSAVEKGEVLEGALVECVAQTVAAKLGSQSKKAGVTSPGGASGMLVAVSNFKIMMRPAAKETLKIDIRIRKRLGPMILVSANISCNGQIVAQGDLSLYA